MIFGIPAKLRRTYVRHVRPVLPTVSYPMWNGVRIPRPRKLLDSVVPATWLKGIHFASHPTYESGLVDALQREVRSGDRILVIGGGLGVTVVTAARLAGPAGHVTCIEAVDARVGDIRETVRLNPGGAPVSVRCGIVARAISLLGDGSGSPIVTPSELPDCDVLEMDCEGAEIDILSSMTIKPRVILVETHGNLGAPSSLVRDLLERLDYVVEDHGPAEIAAVDACIEHDVLILVGHRASLQR